jgi:hypothetical protein
VATCQVNTITEEHGGVQDVGGGIRVATVKDPFGNVLGIIENPHFQISNP